MAEELKETNFIIYISEEDNVNIDVILKDKTIWITQKRMAELFEINVPAISKHLNNIYRDEELSIETTISKMKIVQKEGNRQVKRKLDFYNLDAIITIGY